MIDNNVVSLDLEDVEGERCRAFIIPRTSKRQGVVGTRLQIAKSEILSKKRQVDAQIYAWVKAHKHRKQYYPDTETLSYEHAATLRASAKRAEPHAPVKEVFATRDLDLEIEKYHSDRQAYSNKQQTAMNVAAPRVTNENMDIHERRKSAQFM